LRSDLNGKESRMIETIRSRPVRASLVLCVVLSMVAVTVLAASCGGTSTSKKSNSTTAKLPPGVDSSQVTGSQTTTPDTMPATAPSTAPASGAATTKTANTPANAADLYGAHITVVNATRPDTNKSAISSSQREVKGDYLEVEFTIQDNATDHMVDLSEYSFRLQSPGIAASTYADYYGNVGTYGAYVDENEISASLLSYSDLSPVTYKVKVGELVDKVFCFFDLNPENVGRNPGVTKDNTTLIVHKTSGTDSGEQVSIPLAGYPD
jgi:hypothetical protein